MKNATEDMFNGAQDEGIRQGAAGANETPLENVTRENKQAATEQFTREAAFAAFAGKALTSGMLNEDACRCLVLAHIHGKEGRCPRCKEPLEGKMVINFFGGRRCSCGKCESWFTATTDTFLEGCKLEFRQIFLLAALSYLSTETISTQVIAAAAGVSPDTARVWIKKFKG